MTQDEAEAALQNMCEQARAAYQGIYLYIAPSHLGLTSHLIFPHFPLPPSSPSIHTYTEGDLKQCLSKINKELSFSHFTIRGIIVGGKEHYGFVNTVSADPS